MWSFQVHILSVSEEPLCPHNRLALPRMGNSELTAVVGRRKELGSLFRRPKGQILMEWAEEPGMICMCWNEPPPGHRISEPALGAQVALDIYVSICRLGGED
jgi:hypothetical protein